MESRESRLNLPICFFIAPLKGEDTATRDRFEAVFESVVTPAALETGFMPYDCLCAQPGSVVTSIFERILKARVIVADLTGGNGSVGYELGFAHSRSKPTILLIKQGYTPPYDLGQMQHIKYDDTDRRTLRGAVPQLVAQLKAAKARPPVEWNNPILNAVRVISQTPAPPVAAPDLPPPATITLTDALSHYLGESRGPSVLSEYLSPKPVEPSSLLGALQRYGIPKK